MYLTIFRFFKTDYAGKYSRGTTRTVTRDMSAQLSRCFKICKRKMRHPEEQTIPMQEQRIFLFLFLCKICVYLLPFFIKSTRFYNSN